MAQRIAHVGSWEYYVKEDKAIWSEELFRIFGLKPQQYGPNTTDYVARIHPQDREAINKIMEQMLFNGLCFLKQVLITALSDKMARCELYILNGWSEKLVE